jgi:hypothetical protein
VEVDKSRNSLCDRMKGNNNGAARVIGFVDFREEIESGGGRIGDMKERDVTGGETMGGTNGWKESEKGLVVGFCRVIREKLVSGSIRQLSASLTLSRTTVVLPLSAGRIRIWGLDMREQRA